MANVSVNNITWDSAIINVSGLPYTVMTYSNFRIRIENEWYVSGNDEYHEWNYSDSSSTSYSFSTSSEGWATFTPDTNYTVYIYATLSGAETLLVNTTFTSSGVTRPSATQYLPPYTPPVLHQWVWNDNEIDYVGEANCCVASALANALKILEYKDTGNTTRKFSVSYIYGNRRLHTGGAGSSSGQTGSEEDGMVTGLALDQVKNNGTPLWELVPENETEDMRYPDNRFLEDYYVSTYGSGLLGAETIFYNAQYSGLQQQAILNRTSSKVSCNFYDSETVASYIQNYGFFLHSFCIPNNFYNVGSTGIVLEPDSYSGYNHTILLIGWKTISSTKYWIGLNSWGGLWGDGGLCYIPMDWGCSTEHPNSNANQLWAWEGYSAYVKYVTDNTCPIKVWNGTAWETVNMKKWNGSSWQTIPVKIFG